jgi:hypothetical protein
MKIWRGQFWALSVFLLLGGILPSASVQTPLPASEKIFSIAVPQASLDFSDLDLRDADNKPITDVQATQQMRGLFTQSLSHLLLLNLTPTKRALYDLFANGWDVMLSRLRRAVQVVLSWIAVMMAKSEYRPVSLLHRFVKPPVFGIDLHPVFFIPSSHALRLLASVQLLR